MSVSPSGIGVKPQFELATGVPAGGNRLFFYIGGSVNTKQDTYTTYTGLVANTNPIVLDSLGFVPNELWFDDSKLYKIIYAPPGTDDPPSSQIWTLDNVPSTNRTFVTVDQWISSGFTPNFISATSFSIPGDVTSIFEPYRRIKSINSSGTIYSTIVSSSFSGFTTITVVNDSGVLDAALSTIYYSILTTFNSAIPDTQDKSVKDFGAVGDGVVNDTAAFLNAVATGRNVYVPATANFYALTALSTANKELFYGPGVVKVNGVFTPIPSIPQNNNANLATLSVLKNTLSPIANTTLGSVGEGALNTVVTRTGGNGQYGNWLSQYLVTAATVAGEFDVGITSWVGATNMSAIGASLFGMWAGANTPAANLGQTFTGGSAVGMEVNVGNRWANYTAPVDIGSTRYTVGVQIVPDVLPALDGVNSIACTISVATPAVVTLNSHGYIANQGVVFGGAGTLPTGITAGTTYFVMSTGLAANTFQISASIGGAAINTTGSFVAPITVLPSYSAGFGLVIAQSIHGHAWWNGTLIRFDSIVAGGYGSITNGGSVAGNAPTAMNLIGGFWGTGLDFSAATFSSAALNFSFTNSSSGTATAGAVVSPGNFQGFIKMAMGGTIIKVPYFQN